MAAPGAAEGVGRGWVLDRFWSAVGGVGRVGATQVSDDGRLAHTEDVGDLAPGQARVSEASGVVEVEALAWRSDADLLALGRCCPSDLQPSPTRGATCPGSWQLGVGAVALWTVI